MKATLSITLPLLSSHLFSASWALSSPETFRTLYMHAKDDLRDCPLDDIFLDADDIINIPGRLRDYLLDALDNTILRPSHLLGSALLVAARAWAYVLYDMESRALAEREVVDMTWKKHQWEGVMKSTITLGASLDYLDKDDYSVLGNLIERFHPLDCESIAADWIRFLRSCDRDITGYLQNEADLYRRSQALAKEKIGCSRKRLVAISTDPSSYQPIQVRWDIDPQGPAGLALDEFSGFGDNSEYCRQIDKLGSEDDQCLCSWPFPCHV
ncbi:hypothetical protein GQ53DRAFT_4504 [Thozetella sp. PMI_491]|nr:hypothetical protein GQ53DRAFT_4504 [Thozetella sp. PMI_491]